MDKFSEKAILQILSEEIGFDEAQTYWSLLNKNDEDKFSHNKKYRKLKSLYECGAIFRVKTKGLFNYWPLPPSSILNKENLENKYLKELDKKYIKTFLETLLEKDFSMEINGKQVDEIILFFVKNIMNKSAKLICGGPVIYELIKKESGNLIDKISIVGREDYFKNIPGSEVKLTKKELIGEKRILIIDNKLLLVFFKFFNDSYSGYFTKNIERVNEKIDEFNYFWNSSQ